MCKQRFLKSILETSKTEQVVLPWAKKRANIAATKVSLKPAMPTRKVA